MAFLKNSDNLRNINWDEGFLWDVRFPSIGPFLGAPSPFDSWFPAVSVEEPVYSVSSYQFEIFNKNFKIPEKTNTSELRITFYDDENNTLLGWLKNWVENIMFRQGFSVATISEVLKPVQIAKLNKSKEVIDTRSYLVYPEGSLSYSGSSSSESQTYSLSLVIAGSI